MDKKDKTILDHLAESIDGLASLIFTKDDRPYTWSDRLLIVLIYLIAGLGIVFSLKP